MTLCHSSTSSSSGGKKGEECTQDSHREVDEANDEANDEEYTGDEDSEHVEDNGDEIEQASGFSRE